jgi:hypothetical protein
MSDMPVSANYSRFLASVNGGDPDSRESLDLDALLALEGDEKKSAEDLLVARVKEEDDWRVPPALAALKLKRSVRPMKERLAEAKGRFRLALARALVDMGALDRLDDTVIAMLDEGDPDEGVSAMAATDDLEASKDLMKALVRASRDHESPEVRTLAGAALIHQSKLDEDPLAWKFRPLYLLLGEEDEATRKEAHQKILEITKLPPDVTG